MTTNTQDSRQTTRAGQPVGMETTPTPTSAVNPTSVGGVAVYDQESDRELDSSRHSSTSMMNDPAPLPAKSSTNIVAWIVGIVVLLIIAYFILQMIF